MHLIKKVVKMLEEQIYKEFTEHDIRDINTCETEKIASILKDFTSAIYYYDKAEGKEDEEGKPVSYSEFTEYEVDSKEKITSTIDDMMILLKEKVHDLNLSPIERAELKNKINTMTQNL